MVVTDSFLADLRRVKPKISHSEPEVSFEQELVEDVSELMVVMSAKMYGKRSQKNKQLVKAVSNAVEEN